MLADDYKEKARALAKRCATRALEVERLFTECHDKLAMLAYAQKSQLDGGTFSEMRDGNAVKRKAQAILRDLYSRVYQVIRDGNEAEWDNANKASDALVESVLSDMGLERDNFQRYFARPKQAVDSFGGSFKGGGGLSERVWDVCRDDFAQCESAIAVAMGAGNSAASVSRDVRKYLKNPDALFRRVRDSEGKLHLSKRAAAFHPGSGVYRSAYKNAMRMTRTENNAAYRNADCERWRRLDFVLGYEVRTSNNHPESDICDALKDAYPKSFNFTGWHPQCRCHAVPILASRDEMRRVAEANLDGREYKSPNEVKANANFEKWCAENKGRIDGWRANGKEPWFLMNNKEAVDKALKTKTAKTAKQVADERHAARTPQMVEEIRGQWAERKAVRKYGNAMLSYMGGIKDVTEIDKLRDAMKHPNSEAILEQCKVLKKIGKTILSLDKLADPMKTAKEFSMLEAISVNAAVKKKLAAWEGLTIDEQINKLSFEIQWVEDKKKYSTWKVARNAYEKRLNEVKEEKEWDVINEFLQQAKSYKTKSKAFADIVGKLSEAVGHSTLKDAKKLKADAEKKMAELESSRKSGKTTKVSFGEDDFTKERKDNALWAKKTKEADDVLRERCGEVWKKSTIEERNAIYSYTYSYSSVNEPLRGLTYHGSEGNKKFGLKRIPLIESIISKSSCGRDMWVQRGDDMVSLKKFGLANYESATDGEILALVGRVGTEGAFWSAGVSKGTGFSSKKVIFNIYMPEGTKAMYCEPFSKYGEGCPDGNWDGVKGQKKFGSESEILLQRGTKLMVKKVEKGADGKWYVDVDVIGQNPVKFPYEGGFPYL